mgnify:CR=1 FL=1
MLRFLLIMALWKMVIFMNSTNGQNRIEKYYILSEGDY